MDETQISMDPALAAAADVAREYGHHSGRRSFAGVAVDEPHQGLTVYRVPNAEFDMRLRDLLPVDVSITLVDALHTRDELQVAREQVWDLATALDISAVAIPVDGTVLTVVVAGSETDAQWSLDEVVPGLARAQSATALPV
jgi:hypothetical protein